MSYARHSPGSHALTRRLSFLPLLLIALAALLMIPTQPAEAQSSTPTVYFIQSALTITEGRGPGQIVIQRSHGTGALTVNLTYTDGVGSNGADVSEDLRWTKTSAAFYSNEAQHAAAYDTFVDVHARPDNSVEGDETFTVTIASGTGYTVGTPSTLTVTIKDSPATGASAPKIILSNQNTTAPGTVSADKYAMTLPVAEGGNNFFGVALKASPGTGNTVTVDLELSPTKPCAGHFWSCSATVTSLIPGVDRLIFNDTNWSSAQTVFIRAADNSRVGNEYAMLLLTVFGDGSPAAGVRITMNDNDGTQGGAGDDAAVPEQPEGLTASARVSSADPLRHELTMRWTAPSDGPSPTYYQPVYQGVFDDGVFDDGADIRVTLPWQEWSDGQGVSHTQSVRVVALAPDIHVNVYDFTVRACNDDGCSAYASTVTVKVAGAPEPEQQQQGQSGPPGPVADLQLSATADSVTVTWKAPESGGAPDRYIVHLKPADGSKGKVKKLKAGKTSVTFKKLDSGATYEVRVRAENEAGKGERTTSTVTLPPEGGGQGGQGDPPPTPTPTPTPEPTPEPTPTPTPTPEPEQQEPEEPEQQEPEQGPEEPQNEAWRRYDANGDGVIDRSELDTATSDWLAGKITDEEYQEVVKHHTG